MPQQQVLHVSVGGHRIKVSNPDKELTVAGVMLPHLAGRP